MIHLVDGKTKAKNHVPNQTACEWQNKALHPTFPDFKPIFLTALLYSLYGRHQICCLSLTYSKTQYDFRHKEVTPVPPSLSLAF